jgi:hypothetical protein
MYDLTAKLHSTAFTANGTPLITFEVEQRKDALQMADSFSQGVRIAVKVDKYREKRSLNANAYCWKLLTEIANRLSADKDEIYLQLLKRYGQREMISVQAHIPISEYVKYCDEAGESTLNGKLFKHYFVYKGSSEFDTREMSIFIDGVVSEAKELGIQTDTPEQIAKMKELWGE